MTYNITLKYIVIGDVLVGKTSLVHKYTNNTFFLRPTPTIGVDFEMKTEMIWYNDDKYDITTQIWDTSGDKSYRGLISNYYKNADVVLMVFDITKRKTFKGIKEHYMTYTNYLNTISQNKKVHIILVGNKSDITHKREVLSYNAEKYATSIHVPYYEVSSKTGNNVNEMFNKITSDIIDEFSKLDVREKYESPIIRGYLPVQRPVVGEKNNKCCLFSFLFQGC